MSGKTFKALVVEETGENKFSRAIKNRSVEELPEGEVLIRVSYSSLNYKDALSASGNRGVTKNYPHTPGVDASGIVEQSVSADFKPGDEVTVVMSATSKNLPVGRISKVILANGYVMNATVR